jgi:ankyrin repeat protein
LLFVLLGIWAVHRVREADSTELMACMSANSPPVAWACKQGLLAFHPTPEEVPLLNAVAAALHATTLPHADDARAVLAHLIAHGVDVNARYTYSGSAQGWTALHSAAFEGRADAVCLLLDFGAEPRRRDAGGASPLDIALDQGAKFPSPSRRAVAHILSERAAGRSTGCPPRENR